MDDKLPWVQPGTSVVVYSLEHGRPDAILTTIERVNKVTFTVVDSTRRFKVDSGFSQETGVWTRGYKVVPADSNEASRALRAVEVLRQRRRVVANYERWIKNPTFAHRQAFIDALNAVDSDGE